MSPLPSSPVPGKYGCAGRRCAAKSGNKISEARLPPCVPGLMIRADQGTLSWPAPGGQTGRDLLGTRYLVSLDSACLPAGPSAPGVLARRAVDSGRAGRAGGERRAGTRRVSRMPAGGACRAGAEWRTRPLQGCWCGRSCSTACWLRSGICWWTAASM